MAYKLKKKDGKHVLSKMPEGPMDMKPSLHLSEKDLPALKNWKVGQIYTITLKVKQTSLSQGDMYGPSAGKKPMQARFEVLSAQEEK